MNDRHDVSLIVERASLWHNDYEIADCIGPNGERTIWLLAPPCICGEGHDEQRQHGRAAPIDAPHDQDGPLPDVYRERIDRVLSVTPARDDVPRLPQCGRPTAARRPCRQVVRQEGDACRLHLGQPALHEEDPS